MSITISNAIIDAQSVTQIAERMADAPTKNGVDGCESDELSRNQLLGQHAYYCCMDSDSPIDSDDLAKFEGDFHAYLTEKLFGFVWAAIECLENEAAEADEYPLTRADIEQLNEFSATKHAVKLAIQHWTSPLLDD